MPRCVALLRGINVGGHRVKMDRLRGLFEGVGLRSVSTVIASGNVIFSTDSADLGALRETIERHLARELGYEVATFLRSPAQLAAIAAASPVEEPVSERPSSHFVFFLKDTVPPSLQAKLTDLESEIDHFQVSETEIHWRIEGKLTDSPLFSGGLDQATRGLPMTMRNMNTLRRIVAKTNTAEET